MFETIVLRRRPDGKCISAGQLAEALLFYKQVILFLDYSSLTHLVKQIGAGQLVAVLQRYNILAMFSDELWIPQSSKHDRNLFEFKYYYTADPSMGRWRKEYPERLEPVFVSNGLERRFAEIFADRLSRYCKLGRMESDLIVPDGMINAALSDLEKAPYISRLVNELVDAKLGVELRSDRLFNFGIRREEAGFRVLTNIPFNSINRMSGHPKAYYDSFSTFSILQEVFTTAVDTAILGKFGCAFQTSDRRASQIALRLQSATSNIAINDTQSAALVDAISARAHSIGWLIDNNYRSFSDFERLFEKAQAYRSYIHSTRFDGELLKDYCSYLSDTPMLSRTPVKAFRFVTSAAAAIASPSLGVALSASDSLIVDRLARGWKPQHFLRHNLRGFVTL